MDLATKRRNQELVEIFIVTQNATHADEKKAKKFIKELTGGDI